MATPDVLQSRSKLLAVPILVRKETKAWAADETTCQRATRTIDEIAGACGASDDHVSRGRSKNRAVNTNHCEGVGNQRYCQSRFRKCVRALEVETESKLTNPVRSDCRVQTSGVVMSASLDL